MFTKPTAIGSVQPILLSQIDGQVDDAPVAQQTNLAEIDAQALQVAHEFAAFVARAEQTLDICIYDFRLDLDDVSQLVVDAVNAAADGGVAVRIAYDQAQAGEDGKIMKQFRGAGGDPADVGTETFLTERMHPKVELHAVAEAVAEKAIAPHSHIMHQKYMVADGASARAAVWTGSTNFTVDAWALQENNILVISGCQALAATYEKDFADLWQTASLTGTGAGDTGQTTVGADSVTYAFAPGEGAAIEQLIASTILAATFRLRVASMVISSVAVLAALQSAQGKGIDFQGIYDGSEMDDVRATLGRIPADAARLEQLNAVLATMTAKPSLAYSAGTAHNFMHDKIVVADDRVLTGSFNFSTDAAGNAENVLVIGDSALADLYATYIEGLVARYRAPA